MTSEESAEIKGKLAVAREVSYAFTTSKTFSEAEKKLEVLVSEVIKEAGEMIKQHKTK